jgi:hypothetical protein
MEAINQQMSSTSSIYESDGAANLGALIEWNNRIPVGGVVKTVRMIATIHLMRDDATYAYRRFEGLINCVDNLNASTPRLAVTFDTKSFVSPSAFTSLIHRITRASDRSVSVAFEWFASEGIMNYEATVHIEAYAPLEMGTFRFTSQRI